MFIDYNISNKLLEHYFALRFGNFEDQYRKRIRREKNWTPLKLVNPERAEFEYHRGSCHAVSNSPSPYTRSSHR